MKKRVRPYKVSLETWKMFPTPKPMYNDRGRQILRVAIGEIQDAENPDDHEYVYEDVYKDVLANLFIEKQGYKVLNSYGKNPTILVVCDNDIIPHNPMVSDIINLIHDKFAIMDKNWLVECFVEMKQTRDIVAKKGTREKELYRVLNAKINNISNDIIYYTLMDYVYDDIRRQDSRSMKEKIMSVRELREQAITAYYEKDTESLAQIKNNILQRFLIGDLVENVKGEA